MFLRYLYYHITLSIKTRSFHKGQSSGNRTKLTQHKAKLVSFVRGIRDSGGYSEDISLYSCCINVMDLDTQYLGDSLHTVLTFVKYVGCFQDNVFQNPSHLCNNSTKKYLHSDHLTLLQHTN